MDRKSLFKELLLIFATILWGAAFVFQDQGMGTLGPFEFSFWRCLIGSLFLIILAVVIYLVKRAKGIKYDKSFKTLLIGGSILGVVTASAVILQQVGIKYETAGKSGFITSLYIIFVPLINLLFKKKTGWKLIISIALAVVGLLFINVTDGNITFGVGSICLLGCAIMYAIQILFIDKYSPLCNAIELSAVQFFVATICILPLMFIFKESPSLINLKAGIIPVLYCSIVSIGIAFTIQIYAQSGLNVVVASMIMSLESVFAIIFGIILLKEDYTWLQYLGCFLIFSAVIISQLPSFKKKTSGEEIKKDEQIDNDI